MMPTRTKGKHKKKKEEVSRGTFAVHKISFISWRRGQGGRVENQDETEHTRDEGQKANKQANGGEI
jgi:hypothetical protein